MLRKIDSWVKKGFRSVELAFRTFYYHCCCENMQNNAKTLCVNEWYFIGSFFFLQNKDEVKCTNCLTNVAMGLRRLTEPEMITPQATSCSLKLIVPIKSFVPARYISAWACAPLASPARETTSIRKIRISFIFSCWKVLCNGFGDRRREGERWLDKKILSHTSYRTWKNHAFSFNIASFCSTS